jgi:hypothetical protein
MGWSIGFDSKWNRDIGYGVPALCDYPRCGTRINRGLSYVCGGAPYGGDHGCGLFFCSLHRAYYKHDAEMCTRCARNRTPFEPKPDLPIWTHHKLYDPSWREWRRENRVLVGRMLEQIRIPRMRRRAA